MKKSIRSILRNYREIEVNQPGSEVFFIKQDIDRAIEELDEEERTILELLFFSEPTEFPIRKLNKNGGE
ncbi:MAG TPA: hypothetical protein VEP90_07215, partial [Methylomirabilota bacterium]|nr:hypothetical protein [Methylomirabilota bacterium]